MKILVIGKVWPEPQSSAAGRRMLQLLELLKESGTVTFVTAAARTGYESDPENHGVRIGTIGLNDPGNAAWFAEQQPDIVVYDRFMTEEQFGWLVTENCPNALQVLNTEDLHFLRKARGRAVRTGQMVDLFSDEMARELASIYRCDLSLLISEYEADLLIRELGVPEHLVHYLPLFSEGIHTGLPGFMERKDCVFVGNFLHDPNADAVQWFRQKILPVLRSLDPAIGVHIYGAYPTQSILEFHRPSEKLWVHGRTDDLSMVMKQARINLAPLRYGAGIKGKLMDAMEWGTPSVATSVAVEGMMDGTQWAGTIADDPEQFAREVIALYHNQEQWEQAVMNGKHILESRFRPSDFAETWKERLYNVFQSLEVHRRGSYTAYMTRHQSLQATRYLAKWIMEKESKKGK